jgi:hypothetical protein
MRERPSKASRSDGAGMYSVNPSESTNTLREAGPESRTNAPPSIDKSVEKEYFEFERLACHHKLYSTRIIRIDSNNPYKRIVELRKNIS